MLLSRVKIYLSVDLDPLFFHTLAELKLLRPLTHFFSALIVLNCVKNFEIVKLGMDKKFR
jgi:hypothetical protein